MNKSPLLDFLSNTYENERYEFLARPNQSLFLHIKMMFSQAMEYFLKATWFNSSYSKIIYASISIGIIFHDFGKLNPYFQYRMNSIIHKWPSLPKKIFKFSYHTLFSASFLLFLLERKKDKIKEILDIDEEMFQLLKESLLISVYNHHGKYPRLEPYEEDLFSENGKIQYYYFKFILSSNEKYHNFFKELREQLLCSLDVPTEFHDFTSLNKTLKVITFILESLPNIFTQFIEEVKICDSSEEFILNLGKLQQHFNEYTLGESKDPFSTYFYVLYCISLLCDLDIWDARFFESSSISHKISFVDYLQPQSEGIINDYIQSIKKKSIPDSTSESELIFKRNIIQELRDTLFREVHSTDLHIGQNYILSAPTGAGKTLSLLEIGAKLQKSAKDHFHFTPKIIYNLPFVSIGTQVAAQIYRLFHSNEKNEELVKLFSSPLLTIDNYLTEKVWTYDSHEEFILAAPNQQGIDRENLISKGDGKWLISTWRSQYVVTTFVKLLYSIFKPYKQNYLRFHRIVNSILIFDEIQCIPIRFWQLVHNMVDSFQKIFNTPIILSTATQPGILEPDECTQIAPSHLEKQISTKPVNGNGNQTISSLLNRYKVYFIDQPLKFSLFLLKLRTFLFENLDKDVMIVLNTRKSVFTCYNSLVEDENLTKNSIIRMLSTQILPIHRIERIQQIKSHLITRRRVKAELSLGEEQEKSQKRMILITTQLIEAGVDLSFEYVIRDFAPFDSIIQVAGRCNRSFEYHQGQLFVCSLQDDSVVNPKNKKNHSLQTFYSQVYRCPITAEITQKILTKSSTIENTHFGKAFINSEYSLRKNLPDFFKEIKQRKNTSDLISVVETLSYFQLTKEFNLIEEYDNDVPIFIEIDDVAQKYLQQIKKRRHLIPQFYQYSITTKLDDIYLLQKRNSQPFIKIALDNDTIFYILPHNRLDQFYSNESGFKMIS